MTVEILHYTPIQILDSALTKCWGSECKTGDDMMKRIDRIINKNKHGSIAEHCTVNFDIDGVSRALLQEVARHRHANISVKSSRYTLKELLDEHPFHIARDMDRASNYIVMTDNYAVNVASVDALEQLRYILTLGTSNDVAKYCMPESYKTSFTWTLNIRSLMNLFELRTDKSALLEFRQLSNAMFDVLPDNYKFLLKDYVKVVE